MTLERADDNADGPATIRVSIGSVEDNPGSLVIDATEPVQIKVIKE